MAVEISPNTQVFICILCSVVITVVEAMYSNLKSSLVEAWEIDLPTNVYSGGFEHLLKTAAFLIVLIRGATIHIYLAASLLMFIPIFKERMRIIIIMWLGIAGIRCIVVNAVATIIGAFICSSLPSAHPACFKFIGSKGFELGCSGFMWVLVNDFLFYLRQRNTRALAITQDGEDIKIDAVIKLDKVLLKNMVQSTGDGDQSDSSEETINDISSNEYSSSEGDNLYKKIFEAVREIKKQEIKNRMALNNSATLLAMNTVIRFLDKTFGLKLEGPATEEDEIAETFVQTHSENIHQMIESIRNYVIINCTKGHCKHLNCAYCQEEKADKALFGKVFPEEYHKTYYGMESKYKKCLEKVPYEKKPLSLSFLRKFLLMDSSESSEIPGMNNTHVQTDPLSIGIMRKIEKREKEFGIK